MAPESKFCTKCQREQPASAFGKRTLKSGTVTLQFYCRDCQKAYREANREDIIAKQRAWWADNKEEQNQRQRKYYRNNKPKVRAGIKRWEDANPEKVREIARATYHRHRDKQVARHKAKYQRDKEKLRPTRKAWKKNNPEKLKAGWQAYRARKMNAENTLTSLQWEDRIAEFNNHCAYCLLPLAKAEIEHMNPLSRGGGHTLENVVPACRSCNAKKHDKNLLEFAREATSFDFVRPSVAA